MDGDRVRLTVNIAFGSPIHREIWRWTELAQKYCNGRTCQEINGDADTGRRTQADGTHRKRGYRGMCHASGRSLFRFNGRLSHRPLPVLCAIYVYPSVTWKYVGAGKSPGTSEAPLNRCLGRPHPVWNVLVVNIIQHKIRIYVGWRSLDALRRSKREDAAARISSPFRYDKGRKLLEKRTHIYSSMGTCLLRFFRQKPNPFRYIKVLCQPVPNTDFRVTNLVIISNKNWMKWE